MLKYILLDVDDTILDFRKSQDEAIKYMLDYFGVFVDDKMPEVYHECNAKCWRAYERGEISQAEIFPMRFKLLFDHYSIDTVPYMDAEHVYHPKLDTLAYPREGAMDFLREISTRYKIYIITNGAAKTQDMRLSSSGIDKIVDGIYISERVGYSKPNVKFFQALKDSVEGFDEREAVVIGDSLTSDIRGGNNVGIRTIWYNPKGVENTTDVRPDYIVSTYREILDILPNL